MIEAHREAYRKIFKKLQNIEILFKPIPNLIPQEKWQLAFGRAVFDRIVKPRETPFPILGKGI